MKLRHLALPALSVAGMAFAVVVVHETSKTPPDPPLAVIPARSPFARTLAGSGLVEPSSRFVTVAPLRSGTAVEVLVAPGDRVKRGDVLWRQDARAAEATAKARAADVAVREAERAVRVAEHEQKKAAVGEAASKLGKLKAAPRPEEIPAFEARVQEAAQIAADEEDRLARLEKMLAEGAGVERDVVGSRAALRAKTAAAERARSDLALLKAGSWEPDLSVAKAAIRSAEAAASAAADGVKAADAAVAAARAAAAVAETEVELLTVRAPLDATVLQVELRAGEFVAAGGGGGGGSIVLGTLDPLHVRVDIDENDAALYKSGAPARAFLRGRGGAEMPADLEFVRIEPYVVPKKALTGSVQERVDVRVLQVVYRVAKTPAGLSLYCGQQVDVFVDDPREVP